MIGTYNPVMVLLSLLVAMLASYTALDFSMRINQIRAASLRGWWLAGGALALGTGIWSMHFIGMLALSLPIPMGYDLKLSLASGAIALLVSYVALRLVAMDRLNRWRLGLGGSLLGLGICAMHYVGMASMRMQPGIAYDPLRVAVSILVAIAGSIAALWIAHTLKDGKHRHLLAKRLLASLVMGSAIAGMHYVGMSATSFPLGAICGAASGISPTWLATIVVMSSVAIICVALVVSVLDTLAANRSERLNVSIDSLNTQLVHLATHDELTGLPNRVSLARRLEWALEDAKRENGAIAVIYLDLDGFKAINDSLGHSFGDELLKAVAARLSEGLPGDRLARVGGDEFIVVIERLQSRDIAAEIAASMIRSLQSNLTVRNTSIRVTPSIGISLYPEDGSSVDDLIAHADVAMYDAKDSGRNAYRFFRADMKARAMRALQIQRGLQAAIDDGSLHLHFQPKHDSPSGEVVGAEALARWRHAELGEVPPTEFIAIAERTGLIGRIGEWVLRETCRQLCEWEAQDYPPIRVAINLSPRQLEEPDFVERFSRIVEEAGLSPSRLMFEVTETVAMQDAEQTMAIFHDFKSRGFEFAIDDFGTGYSSLAYLQKFKARQLKIDRYFTHSLDSAGSEAKAIFAAIIALAHTLGMEVVAEGVETASQANELKLLQCDQVQGFFLSEPMAPGEFARLYLGTPIATGG
jgi:diguanylate cyclase (GGDEF)-like protein